MSKIAPLYGIIGGMGPATSTEFLSYIYSQCKGKYEDESKYPRAILISDPLAPNRLQSFKNDNFHSVQVFLEEMIRKLQLFGVNKILICCLVAHACLSKMNQALVKNVISITDLLDEALIKSKKESIILATTMFYDLNLIKGQNAIYVQPDELKVINQFIDRIKINNSEQNYLAFIDYVGQLLDKYKVESVAFACSDLHLVNRFITKNKIPIPFEITDAMDLAANIVVNG